MSAYAEMRLPAEMSFEMFLTNDEPIPPLVQFAFIRNFLDSATLLSYLLRNHRPEDAKTHGFPAVVALESLWKTKAWPPMHATSILSLSLTVLLCVPSLAGALAVLVNALLQHHVGEWGMVSSLSVASAIFVGWPLILLAAVVAAIAGLSPRVPQKLKYTHYVIVAIGTLATFALTVRFGM